MVKMKRTIAYSATSFDTSFDEGIAEDLDEYYNDSSNGEKKLKCRRLTMEQVRALEKNFEQGKRVEPERKLKLARSLGLHPRQIAIWFQNRRARWKTKQLEKDYALLKQDYEAFKAHYVNLKEENSKLQAEIQRLRNTFKIDNQVKTVVDPENMKEINEAICSSIQLGTCTYGGPTPSLEGSMEQKVFPRFEENIVQVQEEEPCYYTKLDDKVRFLWDHWP
ncbi:hypothetical protein SUGI_1077720 [Cryptomeria japonica]|uniref:homeobox-leucine zipper protein ATHB-13 n=1 Tax=Cryptomeria japonica TaxID=3369 RepID=UPI002414B0AA|nr:homeobox-leucine zipper protein ATHB-13 [Cryptomeria japonica]GLJ50592.1 hypothetical protein SUGI_1077720 [Cryptomeria japonica]